MEIERRRGHHLEIDTASTIHHFVRKLTLGSIASLQVRAPLPELVLRLAHRSGLETTASGEQRPHQLDGIPAIVFFLPPSQTGRGWNVRVH